MSVLKFTDVRTCGWVFEKSLPPAVHLCVGEKLFVHLQALSCWDDAGLAAVLSRADQIEVFTAVAGGVCHRSTELKLTEGDALEDVVARAWLASF